MLLACGDKGLPKQKAVSAEEAQAIYNNIVQNVELSQFIMPDEFSATLTYLYEYTETTPDTSVYEKELSKTILMYSKKSQIAYMKLEELVIDGDGELSQSYEQWLVPGETNNATIVYAISKAGNESASEASTVDSNFLDTVTEFFQEGNAGVYSTIGDELVWDGETYEPDEGESLDCYYGSDNEESFQAIEDYKTASEYKPDPNGDEVLDQNYNYYVSFDARDLIVQEAITKTTYIYRSKDGKSESISIDQTEYVFKNSSKGMPKLNKKNFEAK